MQALGRVEIEYNFVLYSQQKARLVAVSALIWFSTICLCGVAVRIVS